MAAALFSIILPTYNAAATLAASIESIVQQDFKDWELLVQDGLSTDDTLAIAASFSEKYPSIKIVSEKDKGIYDAMNKGIGRAAGRWLYFLGSDDRLFGKRVLKNIAGAIEEDPAAEVIYGNVYSERFKGLYDGEFNAGKILRNNISHQAIFLKKEVFEKTGLFDLKYKAQSDWDHNLKWMLLAGIKSKFVPETIAHYADGGFSSLHGDPVFFADLNFNYIRYGQLQLSTWKKVRLLLYELLKSVKRTEMERFKKVLAHLKYV